MVARRFAPEPDGALVDARALDRAIERGRQALGRLQRPDGAWEGQTDLGPGGAAMAWIVEAQLGALGANDAAAGARALLAQQQPDGSFLPYPGAAQGTASATALCWAGLHACGLGSQHPARMRARAFIDAHGGLVGVTAGLRARGDVTPLFLLAAGLVDAGFLPQIPPELALTPFDRLVERRVHAGNIMVVLVLCALVARHRRPAPSGLLSMMAGQGVSLSIRRSLFEWQNDAGDWNGQAVQTWLMLLGLAATGLDHRDARVARALGWLRGLRRSHPDGLTTDVMRTDVWSTAFAALALHAAGEPSDGDALTAAQGHLLAAQCSRPMPRVNQRKKDAARSGGWPFQRGNDTMPDADDTGVALAALGTINGARCTRDVFAATSAGMRWLRDMQNPDGGFPAFVWNLPSKPPGPMFLDDVAIAFDDPVQVFKFVTHPPAELSDPAAEGITGRVLWGLGACGVGRDDPAVCRAIAFLRAQQCPNGAWWGRWMTCYLVETATTLVGLAAVGEDPRASHVERAVRFISGCQNPDGGFGEDPEAYRDPTRAGRGPSAAPVTGFVLLGLLASNADPQVVERAARSLIDVQNGDGGWDNGGWLHTMTPPESFYLYDLPAQALPLLALARYRQWQGRRQKPGADVRS
jgi:squalene-hopene/tetraprenyl-beta-curcumene cyclase